MVICGTLLDPRSSLASKRFGSDGNPSQPVSLLFSLDVYTVYLCYCLPRSDVPANAGPIVKAPDPEDQTPETVGTSLDPPLPMEPPTRFPGHPVLQQLHDLDKSSSKFHIQLSSALHGDEFMRCVTNLQGDDLAWLVEFLDDVRHHAVC